MTAQLERDVERHERSLYGGNGDGLGLLGRVKVVEDFIGELRSERKEAAADRRKIFVTVVSAAIINVLIFVISLLLTHPDLIAHAAGSP